MLQFKLALALGVPHPDILCEMLTADQLGDWEVFNRINPIGADRIDYAAGLIVSAITAQWRKEGARIPVPFDYFPWHNLRPEPLILSPDEQVAAFDRMFPH